MSTQVQRALVIPADQSGRRLDQALAELLPEFSRSRIKAWILSGEILVEGNRVRPRARTETGASVRLSATLSDLPELEPQPVELDVIYQDAAIIVLDKRAGLVVHPGAGNPDNTLQNGLLFHDPDFAGIPRCGIVHRLDKDTTGLMVVARTLEAHHSLSQQLQSRRIRRVYRAVCVGRCVAGGTIDLPLGRHPVERTRMAVRPKGRPSVTHYRVLERFAAHSYLGVQLDTGRTHQIRVHLAHEGHPLVGDPLYGSRLALPRSATPVLAETLQGFKRQALHAFELELRHPVADRLMRWRAPCPADFEALLQALRDHAADSAG